MTLPELREMTKRLDTVDARLEAIEAAQQSFKHSLMADALLSEFVTGDFVQRISDPGVKLAHLEAGA